MATTLAPGCSLGPRARRIAHRNFLAQVLVRSVSFHDLFELLVSLPVFRVYFKEDGIKGRLLLWQVG